MNPEPPGLRDPPQHGNCARAEAQMQTSGIYPCLRTGCRGVGRRDLCIVPHTFPTCPQDSFCLLPFQERGLRRTRPDECTLGNQAWTFCRSFSLRVGTRWGWGCSCESRRAGPRHCRRQRCSVAQSAEAKGHKSAAPARARGFRAGGQQREGALRC